MVGSLPSLSVGSSSTTEIDGEVADGVVENAPVAVGAVIEGAGLAVAVVRSTGLAVLVVRGVCLLLVCLGGGRHLREG